METNITIIELKSWEILPTGPPPGSYSKKEASDTSWLSSESSARTGSDFIATYSNFTFILGKSLKADSTFLKEESPGLKAHYKSK